MVAGALLVVVVATLLAAVLVPDALADRTEPQPDAEIRVEEIAISADNVGGERLDFVTDVRLAHIDGVSENVTVELRAVRLDSGLVEANERVAVGAVEDTREVSASEHLQVERGGDYRIEVIVFRNGVRETVERETVRGTEALTPGYPDSPVGFHRFAKHDLPVIEYQIAESTADSATLDVETYLTNGGEAAAEDLTVVLKARQVDSNIVAAEQVVAVDAIGPSQTARPGAELTVPADYNYYLDAILLNDGVVVDTARTGASLDPTERVPANETERDVELDVGDFDSQNTGQDDGFDDESDAADDDGEAAEEGDDSGAGFGVAVAVLAILAGVVLQARMRTGGDQ